MLSLLFSLLRLQGSCLFFQSTAYLETLPFARINARIERAVVGVFC